MKKVEHFIDHAEQHCKTCGSRLTNKKSWSYRDYCNLKKPCPPTN